MILSFTERAPYAPQVEFVERKGLGHPDTICDAVAEDLSRELALGYIKHTGSVQAFNVDKAILAAGSVEVGFGGGTHLKKARLIVVGKADQRRWQPDIDELRASVGAHLATLLPDADIDVAFDVDVWLTQSSSDLSLVVSGREDDMHVPLANDTSFAVASLPRSPLEETVLQVERTLNSDDFRARVPVGRDIKVMGALGEVASITVASPILAARVGGRSEYDDTIVEVERQVSATASAILGEPPQVAVNQADTGDSPYLSITGSSAEAGDDGQVGRGNRFGGLITPYRPMSMEATCGKNPAAHVGKTYHAVAYDICSRVLAETDATEATVKLLSRIGNPVTEPQMVHVDVAGDAAPAALRQITEDCLLDWNGVRDRLIAGYYDLY